MRVSMPGIVIYMLLIILTLCAIPLYIVSLTYWARSETEMMSDVAELIDKVIDTRMLTDDMLEDFNLSLAAKELNYRAIITREVKVINPDPINPGKTYTAYVVTENISTWEQGDIITVEVESVGESRFTTIAQRLMGLRLGKSRFRLAGRVR